MTDITDLAREAGIVFEQHYESHPQVARAITVPQFEKFAALHRASIIEELTGEMIESDLYVNNENGECFAWGAKANPEMADTREAFYTATQLAAARLQGLEEERSLRAKLMELHAKASLGQSQRIAELEQQLAERVEPLTDVNSTHTPAAWQVWVGADTWNAPMGWQLYNTYDSLRSAEVTARTINAAQQAPFAKVISLYTAPPAAAVSEPLTDQTCWFIEQKLPLIPAEWFVSGPTNYVEFSNDPNKALRFNRRKDAQAMLDWMRSNNKLLCTEPNVDHLYKVTEHMFIDAHNIGGKHAL